MPLYKVTLLFLVTRAKGYSPNPFQHNSVTVHKARSIKTCYADGEEHEWPEQSPDLNHNNQAFSSGCEGQVSEYV